ncbi:hypothetical protein WAE58_21500 [Pedobacter panaciterrae]|uniref:Uncharacterized protein n=1 Tax=Pedobacter panaciterrae TaxID=363849 RepID=A0ABU8NUF3_9SPHI
MHKHNQEVKRDKISRVTSAVMHLLHGSHLYGSSLWPKHGFQSGYGGEFTKSDTVMVGVSIGHNHQMNVSWQSICCNIITNEVIRGKKQAELIDSILDHAIYDEVYIEGNRHPEIDYDYRFKVSEWHYPGGQSHYQLSFKFTLNN